MFKARSTGLALALAGASLALGLATLALARLNAGLFSTNSLLADLPPALSFALVAALILAYRPRHVLGGLMLLIGLLFLLEPFGSLYAAYALRPPTRAAGLTTSPTFTNIDSLVVS